MKKVIFLLMVVMGCSLVRADSTLDSLTTEAIKTKKMETLDLLRRDEGWTILHDAAYRGDVELMRKTLESLQQAGASLQEMNPSVSDQLTYTPLHTAAYEGNANIVRLMLEFLQQAGASSLELNPIRHDRETPLFIASFNGHVKIVQLILEALQKTGASPQEMNPLCSNNGCTPLHFAAQIGFISIVQTLLPFLNAEQIMLANGDGVTALELTRNENCFRGDEIRAAIEARLEELQDKDNR